MPSARFSRILVPRRSHDEAVLGLLALHRPLGFENAGEDLIAFYREASAARGASHVLRRERIDHRLTTDIPEGDPLEAFRAASQPFALGRRLWIDPGDANEGQPPRGRIALRVPASRAFGTGAHESTRLALAALEEESLEDRTLLDVGTGSGILALAAAAFGARRAVSLDMDIDAVFVARDNARLHPFGDRVRLYAGPLSACAGEFDFVVANMLADEILPEGRRLAARAGRRGRVVLSGLTADREREVLARWRTGRWKLAGRRTEREWVCVCLARA